MFQLFKNSSFFGVTFAQFFAALNDNAMRQAFLLIAVESAAQELQASASALFALPFIVFSPIAGQLADRFSKKSIIVLTKAGEIIIVSIAAYSLWIDSLGILLVAILLMATQSTFFSPSKYGILPEILEYEDLSRGNGLIQMTTYVAILLGAALAGILLQVFPVIWTGLAMIVMGILGFLPVLVIESVEPADPESTLDWNGFRSLSSNLSWIRHDRTLLMSMLGFSFFFFLGTLLTLNLNVYGIQVMGLGEAYTSLLMVALSIGLGLGSLLAGRWSGDGVEVGLVPLGILGMATFLIVFTKTIESVYFAYLYLILTGLFGGLFLIPLQTILQEHPPEDEVGDVLGTTNIITFVGVLVASAVYVILIGWFGMSPQILMLVLGMITLLSGFGLVVGLPRAFIRFIFWLLTHTLYRIDIRNTENIPRDGPAIIVANHVSLVDGFLINACFSRLVRFIGFGPFFEIPVVGRLFRLMKMIPVYPGEDDQIEQALEKAREALRNGEAVCIFPEGTLTRTGLMSPVRSGVERLAEDLDAPVVPIRIDEIWGSIFTYSEGKFLWKIPSRIPYPVTITFGEPVEPVTTDHVRETLQELGAKSAEERQANSNTLPAELIRVAHRNPFKQAVADLELDEPVSYIELLTETLCLRDELASRTENESEIGIMLPPTYRGLLANLAVNFCGKTSVNLPLELEDYDPVELVERTNIRTILSSRSVNIPSALTNQNREIINIEDLVESISSWRRLRARFSSWLPAGLMLTGIEKITSESTATVNFTRGTTGELKPVELTHANILANIQSLQQIYALETTDTMLSSLPLSHSYGYTGGLWFPLIMGSGTVMHPDAYDVNNIQDLIEKHEVSAVIGLPSYFQSYLDDGTPEKFSSVELALTGGEPLDKNLYKTFKQTFGIPLLEGYGCAEMSPAISMNVPDVTYDSDTYQIGNKAETVGRPLPGVAIKIVDPETMKRQSPQKKGLILVRGANRMKGYFNDPDKTDRRMHGNWFITGDIGSFDEDGFLILHGRYEMGTAK